MIVQGTLESLKSNEVTKGSRMGR